MKPATRRAVLLGLRVAAEAIAAAAKRPAHEPRPGSIPTRRRPDGVWEAVL